jgi:hypothetical protein
LNRLQRKDKPYQEIFTDLRKVSKELKESLRAGEEIYFADAVHSEDQSQAVCGWIKKGTQKTLQTSGKQLRLHFAGAICLTGMQIFTKKYEAIDAGAMINFLNELETWSSASMIHIILDNARSNKKQKVR